MLQRHAEPKGVLVVSAGERVLVFAAIEQVVPAEAGDPVLPAASEDGVVEFGRLGLLLRAFAGIDPVVVVGALNADSRVAEGQTKCEVDFRQFFFI